MITRAHLDRAALGSCGNPGCDHSAHGAIFPRSKCHTDAPFFVRRIEPPAETGLPPSIVVECCVDGNAVVVLPAADVRLMAASWAGPIGLLEATCHPSDGVWLSYRFGSGLVNVVCYRCSQVVAEIGVA